MSNTLHIFGKWNHFFQKINQNQQSLSLQTIRWKLFLVVHCIRYIIVFVFLGRSGIGEGV